VTAWLTAGAAEIGLVLRATLLLGVAWAVAAALRKAGASAASRHVAWLLGVAGLLVLPILWWLAPPLRLPILRPEAASAAAALPPPAGAAPATLGSLPWEAASWLVYGLGAAALLLRFALCRRLVSRLWRDAEPAGDAAWQDLLSRLSGQLSLSRPVELRIACGPVMPMTWGTLSPKILLPAEARAWPAERRRLVLLHELAHVARCDSLSRSAASLACALYWFHPGAWLAARRLRLEQEFAADDRVLAAGAGARSYALSLLELARCVEDKSWPDHAPAMAGACQLERRLLSITAPVHRERPGTAFLSVSAAAAVAATLAIATGLPVRPLSALSDRLEMEPAIAPLLLAPAEGGLRVEAPAAPDMQRTIPGTEGLSRNVRDGGGAAAAAVPIVPADGRVSEPERRPIEPAQTQQSAPPGNEPAGRAAPASTPQLAVYGPQLRPREDEANDADARIPEEFRGGGGGPGPATGRSRRREPQPRFWIGLELNRPS
jgi:beta-lactamase regulating signal transducer with metallopeptidase domain